MVPKSTRGWLLFACLLMSVVCFELADHLALLGLSAWVASVPHQDIRIVALDSRGKPMSSVAFFHTWFPELIIRDATGSPCFGIQHGLGPIRVAVPPGARVSLDILWPVAGFGKLLLNADGDGLGYATNSSSPATIEIPTDFARSRLLRIKRWVIDHSNGRFASVEARQKLQTAENLLVERRLVSEPSQRTTLSERALTLAMEAGEQEVLAEARESIEKRRRPMMVRVLDANGAATPNVILQVRQTRFDFLFGVYNDGYDPATVTRLTSAGLNYAVLHIPWEQTEPLPAAFSFDQIDRVYNPSELAENNFTLNGHGVIWFASGELPAYMDDMRGNADAISARVKAHLAHVIAHYGDRIGIWEANNEGNTAWARWGLDETGIINVIQAASEEIHRDSPHSKVIVNLSLPLGEDASIKHYPFIRQISSGRVDVSSIDTYQFAQHLIAANVPFDILGLQFYNGGFIDVIPGGIQMPYIDLFRFATELDRYSALGKPLQVTELAVGSVQHRGSGESWWHNAASESTQADYLAGVFTIAYGHPNVTGINWWNLYDEGSFVRGGGLIGASLRPKAAYRRLAELLEGWRSSATISTAADGFATFDGSPGDYEISAQMGSTKFTAHAHLGTDMINLVSFKTNLGAGQIAHRSQHGWTALAGLRLSTAENKGVEKRTTVNEGGFSLDTLDQKTGCNPSTSLSCERQDRGRRLLRLVQ